jgi:hypothetical protein
MVYQPYSYYHYSGSTSSGRNAIKVQEMYVMLKVSGSFYITR